jgi:chemotaxis family two-component system sensor kinase Cph1
MPARRRARSTPNGSCSMADDAGRLFGPLFENSRQPAFVMDPVDDRIVEANPAGCELLGYAREEILTLMTSDIHPAEMPQLRRFLDTALRDGSATAVRFTCRTKSGRFLPTEIALHIVESGGRSYVLGLVQDRSGHRDRPPPAR